MFEVDAVKGPGLRIFPMLKTITSGLQIWFLCFSEEVSNCLLVKLL